MGVQVFVSDPFSHTRKVIEQVELNSSLADFKENVSKGFGVGVREQGIGISHFFSFFNTTFVSSLFRGRKLIYDGEWESNFFLLFLNELLSFFLALHPPNFYARNYVNFNITF